MTVFRLVNFEFRNPAFLILLCFAATFIYCSDNELGNSLPEQVEIIRDSFGIPHITGRDVRSASFGLGYAMAEDHHSSLTRYYRQARGEATLYYGRVYLEADFAVKQFRIYDEAKDKYKNLSELEKDIFEGFSDGLNYFLEVHPEKRNQQSYEVLPEDVLALGIYVSKLQFVYEFNQYINQKQNYKETGSNMWAIGPGRSENGSAC